MTSSKRHSRRPAPRNVHFFKNLSDLAQTRLTSPPTGGINVQGALQARLNAGRKRRTTPSQRAKGGATLNWSIPYCEFTPPSPTKDRRPTMRYLLDTYTTGFYGKGWLLPASLQTPLAAAGCAPAAARRPTKSPLGRTHHLLLGRERGRGKREGSCRFPRPR